MPAVAAPDRPGAERWVPAGADLTGLRAAARECRGCELYAGATQTVFGAGQASARVVLVGEQPGDQEDRQGLPFVGPAGRLLDKALADAGIERADAYVTNAVKHFRFTQAGPGKRRMHQTPDSVHVGACRPWLAAELAVLDPEVVVCLGATAAKALLGPSFRVTRQRGQLLPFAGLDPGAAEEAGRPGAYALATLHPSAILRATDREDAYTGLVADLRVAAEALG
jgi:uracil-DNA glycosylase